MLHESISVNDTTKLDANHMVVVYKRMKDGVVQRRVVQGPCVFVPDAEEWWTIFYLEKSQWILLCFF